MLWYFTYFPKGNLGKMKTEEHCANISMALSGKVGKHLTAEHRPNISMAKSGKAIDSKKRNKIAAAHAAKRDAKWTEEVDASIEGLIKDGVSYAKIASKLGNGLSKGIVEKRWNRHLKVKLQ